MKPRSKGSTPKKPKYHFEGTKNDQNGNKVYMVVELKTGNILEWSEKTFKKNESQVEY
jgi:hypothetical protein